MEKTELPKFLEPEFLKRFRSYLIKYLLVFSIFWVIFLVWSPQIFPFLISPYLKLFKSNSLIFTGIEEVFLVLLKLSFYFTLMLTLPFLVIPIARFLLQHLGEGVKFFKKFSFLFILSLMIGFLVGYFLIIPIFLKVLLFFGQRFEPFLKIDLFVLFLLKVLLFSVLIFQFPLALLGLIKINLLKEEFYQRKKIYFWGFFYGLALLFSPTDFFLQILLTLTFYLFFKLSFWLAKTF
ncbi:MAG: twin-arginine translocase subunit TatC [Thermodesulfobacteriaceae bacterium]|nr:twin-arginine translocase subunit TatC [Thermodesulfobacteriaceae bacterium]MCX8041928.1 twin-arginine translocase subunit TatC [Thermodesulfobacteriaceae bacterium]MDW8136360.1 twin-arginine translocase subunit TatC [Thermodesulfobacterium sp.]